MQAVGRLRTLHTKHTTRIAATKHNMGKSHRLGRTPCLQHTYTWMSFCNYSMR